MVIGNKGKLLIELSGEHPKLPFAELEAVLNGYKLDNKDNDIELLKIARQSDRLVIIDIAGQNIEIINHLASRLGMSRRISEIIAFGNDGQLSTMLENITSPPLCKDSTFKLITHRIQKSQTWPDNVITPLKERIIRYFSKFAQVDVRNPNFEILLYLDTELFLVKKLVDIPRSDFETRKPQNRPYFAPISLHPRLARCLVNLAELEINQIIIDPFCGTGGILIEAGLMGYTIIGSDYDPNMVAGTIRNLNHYRLPNHKIINATIDELPEQLAKSVGNTHKNSNDQINAGAIVTEPPYGRASTTGGEELKSLMKRSFKVFAKILPQEGRVVISLPDPKFAEFAKDDFKLLNEFNFRVHRSLVKSIYIFESLN